MPALLPLPVLTLSLAALAALPALAACAAAEPPRLRSQSLGAVCRQLSARHRATVRTERSLEDLRVLWPEPDEAALQTALQRLAELTDSLIASTGTGTRKTYTLERKLPTVRREQQWQVAALTSAVRQLIQAYAWKEQGDPRAANAGSSQYYLGAEHEQLGARYLRSLTPEQLQWLARGEEVRCPADVLTQAERERLFRSLWSRPGGELGDQQARIAASLEQVRRAGVGLWLGVDREPGGEHVHVMLSYGTPGQTVPSLAIGRFSDAELGLPLTRTNPYRLLEQPATAKPPVPSLPARLRSPLNAPLTIPAGTGWREALEALARITALPVVSDDYLCRLGSNRSSGAPRGLTIEASTPVADVLDRLCDAYNYLWWEKNGCCYFRSRYWVYDVETEVPPGLVEALGAALTRDGRLGAAEMAAVAALPPRRLHGLMRLRVQSDRSLGYVHREFPGFMRLYARLPPAQQADVLAGGTLVRSDAEPSFSMLARMAREPQPVLLRLQQEVRPIPEQSPKGWQVGLTLHLTRQGSTGSARTTFNLAVPRPDAGIAPMPAP